MDLRHFLITVSILTREEEDGGLSSNPKEGLEDLGGMKFKSGIPIPT